MKVLVVGAGVGGLAVTRALLTAGHRVAVFEQAERPRTTGAAITVWSGGTGILRELGVCLDGVGARIDTLETRTDGGEYLFTLDVRRSATRFGLPSLTTPRRLLLERMAEGLAPGTVRYGARYVRSSDFGDHVVLHLADGSTERGDVLIGADGHHSAVRAGMRLGEPARPAGWATWQGIGTFLADVTGPRHGLMINGRAGFCGLLPAGEGLLQWWFSFPYDPGVTGPQLPLLRNRFGHWADPVPTVLAKIDEAGTEMFPHHTHRIPRHWGTGRTTLVGDAAHTMPPIVAQGANQALEDAWVLARSLANGQNDPVAALRRYERLRRRVVRPITRFAATEYTYRYHSPVFDRLIPTTAVSRAYSQWLRGTSNYLRARDQRRHSGTA